MDIKQNSSYAPVNSGPAPSDLPGLKSWKATRSSSSIIADKVATLRDRLADPSTPPAAIPGLEAAIRRVEKQRDPAAQALAASRMAAKVAVDKLEARLADAAASHSKYYLEINDESFKLEHRDHVIINNKAVATEDAGIRAFNVFAWLAAVERLPGAVARKYFYPSNIGWVRYDATAGHWIAHKKHLGKVREGYFANAAAAVVYLFAVRMRRLHRMGIPRKIETFRWSGPEQPCHLEDRRVDEEARNLLSHARDQGGTLEVALENFRYFDKALLGEMGERVLGRAYELDGEGAQ